MEQAGCERNKGRHGRVMNNLVGEQPDLNTWVSKWVYVVHVCGREETMVLLCADLVGTNRVNKTKWHYQSRTMTVWLLPTVFWYNKHSHFITLPISIPLLVCVTQLVLWGMVYYHKQDVSTNRICFVCLLQYFGSIWTCLSTIITMWEMSNQ